MTTTDPHRRAALAAGVAWMARGGGVDEFADYLDDLLGTRLKETTNAR